PLNHQTGILSGNALKISIDENKYPTTLIWQILYNLYITGKLEILRTTGAQPALSMANLKKFQIALPPTLTEQTAIASALSDTDGLITGLEKLIAKKRNIKQGAMQQLLQPKEGWEVKKLGEVATIVRGASPRPIEDAKWFDNQSPIGWVRISDVTKSKKVLNETTQTLSDLGVKNSRLVENGNLIMSICATVGRPILTTFDVCIHDGFVVFRNPQIDKEYLYYFLTFIEDNWSKSGQTGSQMNLNTALINNTEIPFPNSNEEQTRIANIFSDMDAELSALEQKLEKYKKVKLGMMQELLTGKTRLN
ncbi:MAG: restriction endonuclease subunit S, partial [Crocinitomicaceae bacterium]|nr:restriction endonuclease subunit S [Crocinitomicaceae bacterium]